MKKEYEQPSMEVTEFRFAEHIATSPTGCYWGGCATWTHAFVGCNTTYNPGTEGWINLNG